MPTLTTSIAPICFYTLLLFVSACRPHAPHVADPRSIHEIQWDAAHDAEDGERLAEADTGYRLLCEKDPPYVRACFDRARLLYRTDTAAAAREASIRTILRFPNEAFVQSLVKRTARSYLDADAVAEGVTALTALERKMKNDEARDTVLFEIARLARAGNDVAAETETLTTLVRSFGRWQSQLWDDAVWRLSQICRETNELNAEIEWLNTLLAERESSRLIGSYASPYHDDGLLRLGEIFLEAGRFEAAESMFSDLAATSTSRLKDDGALGLARVDLARGHVRAACEKLRRIQQKDGSAKRTAAGLAASNGCGN